MSKPTALPNLLVKLGPVSGAQGGPSKSSLAINEPLWATNCICTPKKEDFQLRTTHWRVYRSAHHYMPKLRQTMSMLLVLLLLLMQHRNHQFSKFGDNLYRDLLDHVLRQVVASMLVFNPLALSSQWNPLHRELLSFSYLESYNFTSIVNTLTKCTH